MQNSAIIGQGISYYLSVGINNFTTSTGFVPKQSHLLNPQNAFSQKVLFLWVSFQFNQILMSPIL